MKHDPIPLNPGERGQDALDFDQQLRSRIVGQEEAIRVVSECIQDFTAGINCPDRPAASLLFLGPTGTGKTRLAEATAEALYGTSKAILKLNCAEFKEQHQISKIIGAPAGYLGHNETKSFITQDKLDKFHTDNMKLSLLLLDEIEKAHTSFWDLLLNILDKGTFTISNGQEVDLRRTIIFMTSNQGAREVSRALRGGMGFNNPIVDSGMPGKVSTAAARKDFSPEFWGRLDRVVVFRSLTEPELFRVIELELAQVQKRILNGDAIHKFVLKCSKEAKLFILNDQIDRSSGGRDIRRSVERNVIRPLSNLMVTGQLALGDIVSITCNGSGLKFGKIPAERISNLPKSEWEDYFSASSG